MIAPSPMVFVIDDDESIRRSVKRLLAGAGYESELFKSAGDFLARSPYAGPSCVIVDVEMPGLNGLDLQKTLTQRRRDEQLVFLTGHGDIPMCAQAMKAGAVDFLPKPVKLAKLLECVERALAHSVKQRHYAAEKNDARRLLDLLTPREFEVMQLLTTGMLNKQVGGELRITEKTVKCHRGHLMQKLGVVSVAELIGLVQKAEVPLARSPTNVA
jgi:FixJ family two-component response regulator